MIIKKWIKICLLACLSHTYIYHATSTGIEKKGFGYSRKLTKLSLSKDQILKKQQSKKNNIKVLLVLGVLGIGMVIISLIINQDTKNRHIDSTQPASSREDRAPNPAPKKRRTNNRNRNKNKKKGGIYVKIDQEIETKIKWYNEPSITATVQDTTNYQDMTPYQSPSISKQELDTLIKLKLGNKDSEIKWLQKIISKKGLIIKLDESKRIAATQQSCQSRITPSITTVADGLLAQTSEAERSNFQLEFRLWSALEKFEEIADDFDSKKNIGGFNQSKDPTIRHLIADYGSYTLKDVKKKLVNSKYGKRVVTKKLIKKIEDLVHNMFPKEYQVPQIAMIFSNMIFQLEMKLDELKSKVKNMIFLTAEDAKLLYSTAPTEGEKTQVENRKHTLQEQEKVQQELDKIMLCCDVIAGLVKENHCFARTMQSIGAMNSLLGNRSVTFPTSLHAQVIALVEELREKAYEATCSELIPTDPSLQQVHIKNYIMQKLATIICLKNGNVTQLDGDASDYGKRIVLRKRTSTASSPEAIIKSTFIKHFNAIEIIKSVGEYLVNKKKSGSIQLNLEEYRSYMLGRLQASGYDTAQEQYMPYLLHEGEGGRYYISLNTRVLVAYLKEIGVLMSKTE
ncbi:MAG: hypothetical protein AAF770_00200 [Bacteroidota bacterium]